MNNGPNRERGSLYTVPEEAVGEARIYGLFKDQRILGYPCDIECVRVEDNDPEVRDLLGYAGVQRGDVAIHVSGFDPFGKKTGAGFIRALGRQQIHWNREHHRENPPAGLGCREPEVCMIVTWDHTGAGRGHRDESIWQHHIFWGGSKAYLSMRGVHAWWRADGFREFSVRDLAERIDRGRPSYLKTAGVQQHEAAFRRMLECEVGVSNNKLPRDHGQVVLRRVGRWTYTFTEGGMTP